MLQEKGPRKQTNVTLPGIIRYALPVLRTFARRVA